MFKGLSDTLHKVSYKDVGQTADPTLQPVLTPDVLLTDPRRQRLVRQIQNLVSLPKAKMEKWVTPLIHRYADYVQNLPETESSFYSQKGGLLDHALERTLLSLEKARPLFVTETPEDELTEPQQLWAYAIFSVCLLHDVGKVVGDLNVELFQSNGNRLKTWLPFEGTMNNENGVFYKYQFIHHYPDTFSRRLTIALAKELMPPKAFKWICSNKDVLYFWLSMLEDDARGVGGMGLLLIRIDNDLINDAIDKIGLDEENVIIGKEKAFSEKGGMFGKQQTESLSDIARSDLAKIGQAFLQWIANAIQSGHLNMSRPPVVLLPGGLMLVSDMYALFVREHPQYKAVQSSLEKAVMLAARHERSATQNAGAKIQQTQTWQDNQTNENLKGLVIPVENLKVSENTKSQMNKQKANAESRFSRVVDAVGPQILPSGQLGDVQMQILNQQPSPVNPRG